MVSPIALGAFKIGRAEGAKYPGAYALPDEGEARAILVGALDLGINLVDTAPAYGLSEERIGAALSDRRGAFHLVTKVGEEFTEGRSSFDFSSGAIRRSVRRSFERLRRDVIDVLLIHSSGADLDVLHRTDAVETLHDLRETGLVRAIGFSGKTVEGARAALAWADVIMVAYHRDDPSHAEVIDEAHEADVGVLVKKGLASGRLSAEDAIPFVLARPGVSSLVIGAVDLGHLRRDVEIAQRAMEASKQR
jgi:aryl-alcohol dehydrogenase-like predicted oxidoreductase